MLSGDWDGNEIAGAVVLVPGPEASATLIVYRGEGFSGLAPLLLLPGVGFAGPMVGQAPTLAVRSATSFALSSEQSAAGRTPWAQHITIAWRDGGFVVAGYEYSFQDRLDLSHHGQSSVNLLTSRYTLWHSPGDKAPEVHREGTSEASHFSLASLTAGYMVSPCEQVFD